jgi:hypothetical protein
LYRRGHRMSTVRFLFFQLTPEGASGILPDMDANCKTINPNLIKTRDLLVLRLIQGATKSGVATDKRKERDRRKCRDFRKNQED